MYLGIGSKNRKTEFQGHLIKINYKNRNQITSISINKVLVPYIVLWPCITQFFLTVTMRETISKEERLILAHYFRGFLLWLLGPTYLVRTSWHLDHVAENILHIMVDRKQRE
jgi:hypothetical protein